nr:MAG TPA: hypothetical protein [Caudoviricetes sp.]
MEFPYGWRSACTQGVPRMHRELQNPQKILQAEEDHRK